MKRDKITISNNGAVYVGENVLMTQSELANLFDVFTSKISSNIKAILKSGVITVSYEHGATQLGNTILPDCYDLEMITALAFRISSPKAKIFRDWITKKALQKNANHIPIIIQCGDSLFLS